MDQEGQHLPGPGTDPNNDQVEEVKPPKAAFNTRRVAELVSGPASSTAGIAMKARKLRSGGGADDIDAARRIGGDHSAIDQNKRVTKQKDRAAKSADSVITAYNNMTAETYVVDVKHIPMVSSPDAVVAHNGAYDNVHAVSQKGSGGSPADRTFFRTLDLIQFDNLYFGPGQYNFAAATDKALKVTHWPDQENLVWGQSVEKTFYLGNFLLDKVDVKFNNDGKVIDFKYTETDLSNVLNENKLRYAGNAAVRDENVNYSDKLRIEAIAGNQASDKYYCPLSNAIPNSTETLRLIREMHLSIGDLMLLSAAKAKEARAFQGWKVYKDGKRESGCVHEMFKSNMDNNNSFRHKSGTDDGTAVSVFYDKEANSKGNAALAILWRDNSEKKYKTKGADLFLAGAMNKNFYSMSSALKVAKATRKLECHEAFYKELQLQEVFGPMAGNGSGITPVFMSDGAQVTTTVSMEATSGIEHDGTEPIDTTHVKPLFTMKYGELRGLKYSNIFNYFTIGLIKFLNKHSDVIKDRLYYDENTQTYSLEIPVTSTAFGFSLWDELLCAAAGDIIETREMAIHMVDEFNEGTGTKLFSQAHELTETDMNLPNAKVVEDEHGWTIMSETDLDPTLYPRLIVPEVFTPIAYIDADAGDGTTTNAYVAKTILPWYFSQDATEVIQVNNKGFKFVDKPHGLAVNTFFNVRGGTTFSYLDDIVNMDPQKLLLRMDKMICLPGADKVCVQDAKFTAMAYKFGLRDDGIPMMNYFAAQHAGQAKDVSKRLTILDILKTPRELGLSCVAPAGVITPRYDNHTESQSKGKCGYCSLDSAYLYTSGPSFRLFYWHSAPQVANTLFDENLELDYAANFKAQYDVIEATPEGAKVDIGVFLTANEGNKSYLSEHIKPFVVVNTDNGDYDDATGLFKQAEVPVGNDGWNEDLDVLTCIKPLYVRMQLLPFVINPFDVNTFGFNGAAKPAKWTGINSSNPMDFLQLYGLCGFESGEYEQATYNRNKQMIEQGSEFISDPYIELR